MGTDPQRPQYGLAEELANTITHGAGLALSVAGLAALVALAASRGGFARVASCAIYGTSLVAMYLASTLYHGVRSRRAKRALKVADHCAIFVLIAGTYTPITLIVLRDTLGWALFGVVWCVAAGGVMFKIVYAHRFKVIGTTIYLLMGWMAIVAIEPLYARLDALAIGLVVGGGLAYSVGAILYLAKRLPYNHAVWHVFVLAGSLCHYLAILLYVAQEPH